MSRPILSAALATILILTLGLVLQRCRIETLQTERRDCLARVESLQRGAGAADVELAEHRIALAEQSAQVAVLSAESSALRSRAAAAEAGAREVQVVYRDRVREVLIAPVPTQCEEAARWGADQARQAVQLWRARSPH